MDERLHQFMMVLLLLIAIVLGFIINSNEQKLEEHGQYVQDKMINLAGKAAGVSTPSYIPDLPSKVSYFRATPLPNTVDLRMEWGTTQETDNKGFTLQASDDGQSFLDVPDTFIAGGGTTNAQRHYTLVQKNVGKGTYYYRLKQASTDGSFHYGEWLKVKVS